MSKEELIEQIITGGAQQESTEVKWVWKKLNEIKPKKILEIGTGCGAFTTLLALSGADVNTVDHIINKVKWWEDKDVERGKITQFEGNSNDIKMAERVNGLYDLVVIDADHTEKAGWKDWDLYSPMAPIVMIHDTVQWELKRDNDWFPSKFAEGLHEVEGFKEKHGIKEFEEFKDCKNGGWVIVYK